LTLTGFTAATFFAASGFGAGAGEVAGLVAVAVAGATTAAVTGAVTDAAAMGTDVLSVFMGCILNGIYGIYRLKGPFERGSNF